MNAACYQATVAFFRLRGRSTKRRASFGLLGSHEIVTLVEAAAAAAASAALGDVVNYFLGALGELIQRMTAVTATYGLALPDNKQYRGLVQHLPGLARGRLNHAIFSVDRATTVAREYRRYRVAHPSRSTAHICP